MLSKISQIDSIISFCGHLREIWKWLLMSGASFATLSVILGSFTERIQELAPVSYLWLMGLGCIVGMLIGITAYEFCRVSMPNFKCDVKTLQDISHLFAVIQEDILNRSRSYDASFDQNYASLVSYEGIFYDSRLAREYKAIKHAYAIAIHDRKRYRTDDDRLFVEGLIKENYPPLKRALDHDYVKRSNPRRQA